MWETSIEGENILPVESSLRETVEGFLREARGYVSRRPINGKAIFSLSGGLDSFLCIALGLESRGEFLDEGFGLEKAYPIFFDRGQKAAGEEKKSVLWQDDFLAERYGERYERVKVVDREIPDKELRCSPQQGIGLPMRQMELVSGCVQYAYLLDEEKAKELGLEAESLPEKERVRNIYLGEFEGRCSTNYSHSTLLALRVMNLVVCQNTGDYSWQVGSLLHDPEFHIIGDKAAWVKWAEEKELPLGHTFSCYQPVYEEKKGVHCGVCSSCENRKKAFELAGAEDPTRYAG